MLSPRSWSIVALLLLSVLFAGANLWFTAARSTIPLELRGKITQKQRLIEKTLGVDDVYIVRLDSERRIQVDGPVFDAVAQGQTVNKPAWTRNLVIDGQDFSLLWSRDFLGMVWAMPLSVVTCVLMGKMIADRPR